MNAEQTALLRKAAKGLGAARVLIEAAYFGSAVSEAYYVMFNTAKAALIEKNILRHKHGAVIAAFGEHFAKPGVLPYELHQWLIAAEKDRVMSDYGVDREPDIDSARRSIEHAERFLMEVRTIIEKEPDTNGR